MSGDEASAASTASSVVYQRLYSSRDLYAFLMLFFVLAIGTLGLGMLVLGAPFVVTLIWGAAYLGISTLLLLNILRGGWDWVIVDQEKLRWGNSKGEDYLRLDRIKKIHRHRGMGLEIEVIGGSRSALRYPFIRHSKPLIDAMVQVNPKIEVIRYSDPDGGSF